MKINQKNIALVALLGIMIIFIFRSNLLTVIYYNDSETSFLATYTETSPETPNLTEYINKGASYFLESYSCFLLVLKEVELAGLENRDDKKAKKNIECAIDNMNTAVTIYKELIEKITNSESNPYNSDIIKKLKKFDYASFQEKTKSIKPIFDEVKGYLNEGKIREMYRKMLLDCENILKYLKYLSMNFSLYREESKLWDLNQYYSRSLLFGQYVARIFNEIKKDKRKSMK